MSSTSLKIQHIWAAYLRGLHDRPIQTKTPTAALLFAVAFLVSARKFGANSTLPPSKILKKSELDVTGLAVYALWGAVTTPVNHY